MKRVALATVLGNSIPLLRLGVWRPEAQDLAVAGAQVHGRRVPAADVA